jgi:hypothetical protein
MFPLMAHLGFGGASAALCKGDFLGVAKSNCWLSSGEDATVSCKPWGDAGGGMGRGGSIGVA